MVSPRKATSALSLIPEERCKMTPTSTKSCESLYSNASSQSKNSATVLYRRKTPPMGNNGGMRQATLIPATTEVRQRVLSARRLRMKTYQNQLADAQQTIAELAHENRILRTLHKRQDSALSKYESTNAELPQLLHSHAEELRVWQTKYRNLQQLNKDLEHRLKQKEAVILSLSDQNKHYSQLNKDKNLDERQRLSEKLQALETRLQEKDNDMKLFARRAQLEAKNQKQQILNEQKKTKDVLIKLEKARLELSGYRKLDEYNLSESYAGLSLRRKGNISDEPKLEKDLEKILEKPEYTDQSTDENEHTHRSLRNNPFPSKRENSTMRKINASPAVEPKQPTAMPRRLDRGGGDCDASVLSDLKKAPASKQQLTRELSPKKSKTPEYEDDYENGIEDDDNDDVDGDIDDNNDDNDDIANDTDQLCTDNDNAEEEVVDTNDDTEQAEDDSEDDDDIDVILSATTKPPTRMKEEISSIRKQISDDYKEREAFLDTFCRQATNSALLEEPPKRNSVTLSRNSGRKNKLLAALKAIDDNKSQD